MAEREMREESLDSDRDYAKRSPCLSGDDNDNSSSILQGSSNKWHNMFSQVPGFPEELWEMILDLVQDSESIQNVIFAFPNFRSTFENNIPLWLFDQSACMSDEVRRELRRNPDVSLSGLTELLVDGDHFLNNTENFRNILSLVPVDGLQKLKISGIYPESTHAYFRAFEGFKLRVLETSWSKSWNNPYNRPRRSMCLSEHWGQTTCETTALDKVNSIKLPALQVLRVKHEWWLSYRFLTWIGSRVNLEITAESQVRISIDQPVCYYDEITPELHKWICQETAMMNKSLIWNLVPGLQSLKLIYKRRNMVDVTVFTYRRADFLP